MSEARSALATSAGFCRSWQASNNALWAMVLAQEAGGGSVRDFVQSSERRFDALDAPDVIAARAVALTVQQLGARSVASRRGAVLFDARVAHAIVSDLVGALSGGPQVRRAGVLLDAAGHTVAPAHVDLHEDPYEPFGLASGGFDGEGIAGTTAR